MGFFDWARRDLKRFAVEFLCLSMLLQGYPAHALQQQAAKSAPQPATVARQPADEQRRVRALRRGAPESSSVTSPGGSDGPPVA